MNKEMNWFFVRENFNKLYKDVFNKECEVQDIINLTYSEAMTFTYEDLASEMKRVEKEMLFILNEVTSQRVEKNNIYTARKLYSWCFNMLDNLMWMYDNKEEE